MYKLYNVSINGLWVGTVTAPSHGSAECDAAWQYGKDARVSLA